MWLLCGWDRKEAAKDVLGDWAGYLIIIRTIIQRYTAALKDHGLLSLSYSNIPGVEGTWNILALLIMAYMRHTEVYSPLPPLPDDHLESQKSFWFHFYHSNDVDTRWIPKAFEQELYLLASALDILAPQREEVHADGRLITDAHDTMTLLRFSRSHSRPRLSTMRRPFSLWASIAYATASGCETRGLSDLVCALKGANFCRNNIQTITGPIIGETLRILKEGFNFGKSTGSLLFFCSVLHKVLSWEREGGLFPFSEANIEYLVNDIFIDILSILKQSRRLIRDENMIGVLEENSDPEESANTPLYDLGDLYVAPVQGLSQAAQEPSRALYWLDNRNLRRVVLRVDEDQRRLCWRITEGSCRRVVLDEDNNLICSRIMKGRSQNISPHAP